MRSYCKVIILLTLVSLSFCKKEKQSADSLVDEGIKYLQVKDWAKASEYFSRAIDIEPENPRARMAMALAQTGSLFENIEKVVIELGNIFAQLIGGFSPPAYHIYHKDITEQATLNDLIFYVLDSNILQPISLILENSEIAADSEDNWSIYIENLTFTAKFRETIFWQISLTGEIDRTDAALLSFAFRLAEAILKLLLSIDIHLDVRNFARVFEYIQQNGGISEIGRDPRKIIINVIPFLLNDRESFLGIEPKRGLKYMKEEIPRTIIKSAEYGIKFYNSISSEKDDQEDDLIAIVIEREEEGRKIGKIAFPTSSTYFYDRDLSERFGRPVATISIPPPDLTDFFQNIKESVENGKQIMWRNIVETLSFIIVVVVKTGIFDYFINSLANSVERTGLPSNIIQNISSIIDVGIISGLIVGVIPDEISFSLKPIFEKPISLRDILPVWNDEPRFILEWECFSDSPKVKPLAESNPFFIFFCKYPKPSYCFKRSETTCDIRRYECVWSPLSAEPICERYCPADCEQNQTEEEICIQWNGGTCEKFCVERKNIKYPSGAVESSCNGTLYFSDSSHFLNPGKTNTKSQPIPQDGLLSIMPYILFQSPNLYGVLYINKNYLRSVLPAEFRENVKGSGYGLPDNFEMNAFIQIVGRNLVNIAAQFGIR